MHSGLGVGTVGVRLDLVRTLAPTRPWAPAEVTLTPNSIGSSRHSSPLTAPATAVDRQAALQGPDQMGETWRIGTSSMVVATASTVAGRAAPLTPTPLTVAILNDAGLPPRVVERAKRATTEIYRRIAVSVTWLAGPWVADAVPTDRPACPDSATPLIRVRLVGRSANADRPNDNLGFAVSGGTLASVLVKPVADLANRESLNVGDLLGVVMAHEIGHLLLPANSHSMGIMAARIDLFWISRGGPSFTQPQASMIRARLISMADCKQRGLTSSKDGVH